MTDDRCYWLELLGRVAMPVLSAMSVGELKRRMPIEQRDPKHDRQPYAHLEAIGRLLSGIAPWLELEFELELADEETAGGITSTEMGELARQSIRSAVDPASEDYCNFSVGGQPLVDAAFLALAVLRAPNALWKRLDESTRRLMLDALRQTRKITPGENNWLLFSATIEAMQCAVGEDFDAKRIEYAVRQHEHWYAGDGSYGDGPEFHFDYYNSFVIHPMLLTVVETTMNAPGVHSRSQWPAILSRARRYSKIQERLIAPDGSYPPIGRSITYRGGAFHLLALMALRHQLHSDLSPAQVRCALTAMLHRTMNASGTFDGEGWLRIGVSGYQPQLAENYICTGSLYLCATALLPLGLPAADPFWASPAEAWTAQHVWGGIDTAADHAE